MWRNDYRLRGRGKAREAAGGGRVLGVAGAGRGTGVTHLCILAANYLASCRQRRVAIIEWNCHGDFERVRRVLVKRGKPAAAPACFRLLEVDYYTCGDSQVLARCMDGSYDDIVIDFGELRETIHAEWLRCSTTLIAASLEDWKLEAFLEFLSGEEKLGDRWIYAAAFGSARTQREIERQFHISLKRVPLSVDAFSVDRTAMAWCESILT